jgi:ferredoxin
MTDSTGMRQALFEIAQRSACPVVGVADLDSLKREVPGFMDSLAGLKVNRAVVTLYPLQRGVLSLIEIGPNALYMHHYRQVNYQLDTVALEMANYLESLGHLTVSVAASQTISKKPMLGHVSHRLLAQWAGLGWRGRNNLLVTEKWGAAIRLVSVLTDAPLDPDEPIRESQCGSCRACVTACPAKAIGETAEQFDLERCYEKLTEHTHIPFVSQHICGVCQKVCLGRLNCRSGQEAR